MTTAAMAFADKIFRLFPCLGATLSLDTLSLLGIGGVTGLRVRALLQIPGALHIYK